MDIYNNLADKEQYFQCQRIDTEEELLNVVQELAGRNNFAYRGAKEARYMMYSSAQRKWENTERTESGDAYHKSIAEMIDMLRRDEGYQQFIGKHNIPDTDFFILGLMQHYWELSPILDFTLDPYTALFFAMDGLDEPKGQHEEIDEYFSIYYFDSSDPNFCSVQDVERHGAGNANALIADFQNHNPDAYVDSTQVEEEMRRLAYQTFKDIPFIKVDGGDIGATNIDIPAINFTCSYDMNQPRIAVQHGLFICNNSQSTPLEIVLAKPNFGKSIHCLNIKKSLAIYIKEQMLRPKGICKEKIYPDDEDSELIKEYSCKVHKKFDPTTRKPPLCLWVLFTLAVIDLLLLALPLNA